MKTECVFVRVSTDACVCVCVFGGNDCVHASMCETDGQPLWRTIVPAHCANIDRQQASQSCAKKDRITKKRGGISLCPRFTAAQSDDSQTR